MPSGPRGHSSTTELVETFTLDSSGYDAGSSPTYDNNGNMTFDGTQVYSYDAWNRLVGVAHGYTDGSGDVQAGATFDTFAYDGLGRRISEVVTGEGSGHDQPTDFYFSAGGQIIEERRNPDDIIRENVWGLEYVNELVQSSVVMNPESHTLNYLDTYSVIQDANWNVIGIVDVNGILTERYTYDPYGNKQTYVSGGSDDLSLMTPINPASRALDADGLQNYPLMEVKFTFDSGTGNVTLISPGGATSGNTITVPVTDTISSLFRNAAQKWEKSL